MVKHLYFNPNNFDHLLLSGILIEMFKTDIQVHSQPDDQTLKFVQGINIIENNIEAILRFSNSICKRKIFGKNRNEEAVINMINGVCKDIEVKLKNQENLSQQLKAKFTYLNNYWKQNQWFKKRFILCHMNLLSISFKIQQKYPQVLSKYQVFVQLRKHFIQKMMPRDALQAMFAHPNNKYRQFDLFPEMQTQIIQQPTQSSELVEKAVQLQSRQIQSTQYVSVPPSHISNLQDTQKFEVLESAVSEQRFDTMNLQQTTQQNITVQCQIRDTNNFQILQNTETHPSSEVIETMIDESTVQRMYDQMRVVESQVAPAPVSNRLQKYVDDEHTKDEQKHQQQKSIPVYIQQSKIEIISSQLKITENNKQQLGYTNHEQKVHRSDEQQQRQINLNDYEAVEQQVHQTLQQAVSHQQAIKLRQDQTALDKVQHIERNDMKKSIKQSFSQHMTRPLEFSTKSFAAQQKETHQQKVVKQHKNDQQHHHQEKKSQQKEHKTQQQNKKQDKLKLKIDAVIDQAQSKQYVQEQPPMIESNQPHKTQIKPDMSKKNVQQTKQIKKTQTQTKQIKKEQNKESISKAPQSQSSKAGPMSQMDKSRSIKPKQTKAQTGSPQSCKCLIY